MGPISPNLAGKPMDQEKLQSILDHWQHFAPCPGVNVSIVHGDQCWHGSSGLSDVATQRRMTPRRPGYVFSITKTFTAILVMRLWEQGLVDLDSDIQSYLNGFDFLGRVTIRQLLSHVGGVSSYTEWSNYAPSVRQSPGEPWSGADLVAQLKGKEMDFTPGSKWHYSNTGYMLLRLLIEASTNQSYGDNLADQIAKPLGLVQTFAANSIQGEAIMPGYTRETSVNQTMEACHFHYHPDWCYTGLVVSTTEEVCRVYQALFTGGLVCPDSLEQMVQPVDIGYSAGPHFRRPCYGLGLMIDPDGDYGGSYGHGGGGPGFGSWVVYHPGNAGNAGNAGKARNTGTVGSSEKPFFMTVLCNATIGNPPWFLARDLARSVLDS